MDIRCTDTNQFICLANDAKCRDFDKVWNFTNVLPSRILQEQILQCSKAILDSGEEYCQKKTQLLNDSVTSLKSNIEYLRTESICLISDLINRLLEFSQQLQQEDVGKRLILETNQVLQNTFDEIREEYLKFKNEHKDIQEMTELYKGLSLDLSSNQVQKAEINTRFGRMMKFFGQLNQHKDSMLIHLE